MRVTGPAAATAGFFDVCSDRPSAVLLIGCTRIDEAPPSNVSRASANFRLNCVVFVMVESRIGLQTGCFSLTLAKI